MDPLELFQPAVARWFRQTLGEPTHAQARGWPPVARGESTLLLAPTGSGKTLAAFLVAIDRLLRQPPRSGKERARVLYVSPLKALAFDVERNLRAPIEGIRAAAPEATPLLHLPTVDVRTGDTPARDRARMARAPADILITTPESLYLILTSAAREILKSIETLIVDEIHALVPTKRGAHLALSIERLEALRPPGSPPLQRIGLSATQRPVEEAARLLGGFHDSMPRPVTVVDAGPRKDIRLRIDSVPRHGAKGRDEPGSPGKSAWPEVHARVAELVRSHTSTIVFVNSRGLAERLATAINEAAGENLALAHHGSLAREKRVAVEERLKRGELRAIVATSSLELGIDMGAVDLVVQIESPPSVASGLQRVGRACHGVSGVPRGVILPKHRQDLIACAAAAASMMAGEVEATRYPRSPLDVLSQQIVALASVRDPGQDARLPVEDLFSLVRRAAPFVDLARGTFDGVLDMLSGRYPSDEFAELRPRITWDRDRGFIEGRVGAHRLAVTNGGTIPDRGLYGVFEGAPASSEASSGDAKPSGRRVGELDEEMVFELRQGEVFLLGASSWRADQITHDRVLVSPAAGEPGKMPFWHGDRPGRAHALGERIGQLVRAIAERRIGAGELRETHAMSPAAAEALVAYVREQVEATGEPPSDRTLLIERFVDDVGDWRVVLLCPLGTRVLAPWALVVAARLREKYVDVDLHYTDDGMAFRIPACEAAPPVELFLPPSESVEAMLTEALRGTALFAARFRECAARALLLPRRDPRRRTPLWAQRKRAGDLLAVASRHPSFPIVLETYRECLRDAFDLPNLIALLRDVESRHVRVVTRDGSGPSPFAASVLFFFVANFIYEKDAPPAERRALSLTLDHRRLQELLGETELRTLLDPSVIEEHARGLQRLSRPATSLDATHDLLLSVGDLTADELRARTAAEGGASWGRALVAARRALLVQIAGEPRFVAVEDAARVRDALGVEVPDSLPAALLEPSRNPLRELVARFARTHGPFVPAQVASRLGIAEAAVEVETAELAREGRLVEGAFLAEGTTVELCARDVLDALRRKSLGKVRRAVEPVAPATLARFVVDWQGLTHKRRGRDGLLDAIAEIQGYPLVASTLESEILPARVDSYRSWDLDSLCASGEVVWAGLESLGASDGRIALYLAPREALLSRPTNLVEGELAAGIRGVLGRRGAVFFVDIAREVGGFPAALSDALWQMVWAGEVTNDTLEPLRSRARALSAESRRRPHPRRTNGLGRPQIGSAGARSAGGVPLGCEGRWSLRSSRWSQPPLETDRRVAVAQMLLGRYGLVTREAAQAEGLTGGFAVVYDVLKALEDQGRVRRGYFVEGLGGAQFVLPGADERLRALRENPGASDRGPSPAIVLAATDPANAWGALLDWPRPADAALEMRPQRAAGAMVVFSEGALLGWMGRGDHPLLTFLAEEEPARGDGARRLAAALAGLVDGGARSALLISTVDGVEGARSPLSAAFLRAGFVASTRGLLKRRIRPSASSPIASTR